MFQFKVLAAKIDLCSKVVMLVKFVIFHNGRSRAPNEVKFLWHATHVIVDVW